MVRFSRFRKKQGEGRTQAPFHRQNSVSGKLLSYQVSNLQGIGRRETQEDAFAFVHALDVTAIREKGLLSVVADGMGGMEDGSFASRTVISSVRRDFEDFDYEKSISAQLRAALCRAGGRIYDTLGGDGGSTAAICLFYEECLYYAGIGDSFVYLLRDGLLIRLNREQNILHRRYLDAIRNGRIDREAVPAGPEDHAITQFAGCSELDEIDVFLQPLALQDGDVVLLCSDGVGDTLPADVLQQCLACGSPAEICAMMEQKIRARDLESQDNYTALVIRCSF